HLRFGSANVLEVELDSTERPDIPPFGGNIDYLTFGGIYRDVRLRVVPQTFIENLYAKPVRVLSDDRALMVRCYLGGKPEAGSLQLRLSKSENILKTRSAKIDTPAAPYHDVLLEGLGPIQLWHLRNPVLYGVEVLLDNGDRYHTRVGFREARFTP